MGADVKLKICGVTNADDLRACRDAGVHAVGINLWAKSPRHVPLADAARMLEEVRREGALPRIVLVVVDPEPDVLGRAIATLRPDAIQPHGDAPVGPYAARAVAAGIDWIRVVRGEVDPGGQCEIEPPPSWVLLDSAVPGFGGQGTALPWDYAAAAVRTLAPAAVWLAGGLHPGNAGRAIARVQPSGLDVATGAEVPGDRRRKDRAAIATLVSICRATNR